MAPAGNQKNEDAIPAEAPRSPRNPVRVFTAGLVAVMTLSGASLGVWALHSYHRKDAYLLDVEREMRAAGRSTTAEGCVDLVLAWRPRCQGSPLLCDSFAPRAMRACLEAKDRTGYCQSLPTRRGSARFGFADCQRRRVTRATRKTCGATFKMLDLFCRKREQRR